jgi:hypothetical protein
MKRREWPIVHSDNLWITPVWIPTIKLVSTPEYKAANTAVGGAISWADVELVMGMEDFVTSAVGSGTWRKSYSEDMEVVTSPYPQFRPVTVPEVLSGKGREEEERFLLCFCEPQQRARHYTTASCSSNGYITSRSLLFSLTENGTPQIQYTSNIRQPTRSGPPVYLNCAP